MAAISSQITNLTIVYSSVYSGADPRKYQSSPPLAFVTTGEFPAQMASNVENVSIWWRHHERLEKVYCSTSISDQCNNMDAVMMNDIWIWASVILNSYVKIKL